MIYVVLGMHKSGTTLVARTLHRAGIDMGDGLDHRRSYDAGEKFERESTKAINHAILRSDGLFSLDVAAPAGPIEVGAELRTEMRGVIETSGATSRDWGFKDPRTCLTYPIWAEELPEHRLIVVFRSPEAMWPRYRPRERRFVPTQACRLVRSWCEHYDRLLEHLDRESTQALVVDYERLMTDDDELRRLGRFVERELPDERHPGLNRGRDRRYPSLRMARVVVRVCYGLDTAKIADRLRAAMRA